MNKEMDLQAPKNVGKFLTSWGTANVRRTLLQGVNQPVSSTVCVLLCGLCMQLARVTFERKRLHIILRFHGVLIQYNRYWFNGGKPTFREPSLSSSSWTWLLWNLFWRQSIPWRQGQRQSFKYWFTCHWTNLTQLLAWEYVIENSCFC